MADPLRVLLTNIRLDGRTGTEIVTRNIALELLRQGHMPAVFTLQEGPICGELRGASIPVATDIGKLSGGFDVIHGHHNPTTAIAAARFPDVPAIFVCHDFLAWHDVPPKLANVRRFVAVDNAVADRLTQQEGIAPDLVQVILNAVDIRRFRPGAPLPASPRRAVLFAKQSEPIREVRAACDLLGISLDVVGPAVGDVTAVPEQLMTQYDLVFASAMTALEALACGRAVVVCDGRGLAGLVSGANCDEWRVLNFGRRTLTRPVERDLLVAEIRKYDTNDAAGLMSRIRDEASTTAQVSSYLSCYRDVIAEQRDQRVDHALSLRLLSEHLQFWTPRTDPAWPWMEERSRLVEQLTLAQREREPVSFDQKISFSNDGEPWRHFLMHGFGPSESWGAWALGDEARLRFDPSQPLEGGELLELVVLPFVNELHRTMDVDIDVNGKLAGSRRFRSHEGAEWQRWVIEIPESPDPATIRLRLRMRSSASPKEIGMSEDLRRLGLGLVSLTLRQKPNATAGGNAKSRLWRRA